MSEIILPSTFVGLLVAFEPCFHAPSVSARLRLIGGVAGERCFR